MHQLVEYLIGALLISQGFQSSEPMIPTVLGVAVLVNAAVAKGPLGAFPKLHRHVHRVVDVVLLALIVLAVLFAGDAITSTVRFVLIGAAVVYGVVVLRTNYAPPVKRQPISADGGRSTEIGRLAGRATGVAVNAARRRRRS